MAKREILLTAYSPVSSNTFKERLNQIEKSIVNLQKAEKSINEKIEELKKGSNNLDEIEKEENKLVKNCEEIERLKGIQSKLNQSKDKFEKNNPNKEGRVLFDTVNKVWRPKVESVEFECLHLNHAYTTSESAFKELVIPYNKREWVDGKEIEEHEACKIDKVFAFTTKKVRTFTLKDTYDHSGDEIISVDNENVTAGMINEKFIESRFKAIHKFADNGIEKLEFDHLLVEENSVNPIASIQSVLNMVELVESYIKDHESDDVTIHVDMSGGFRHIPLILLMVLNILQRTNHNIGKIMYTMLLDGEVKIEQINDIFDMQRFTNGVHEFIEFGSGIELDKFYKLSKAKTDLEDSSADYDKKISDFTDAVNGFSNAITLSDRNEFRKAVKGIEKAWKNLETDISEYDKAKKLEQQKREENEKNNEKKKSPSAIDNNLGLLQTFSPRIKKEYEQLWETDNELDYILWCLDHNFVQQALTLYSEILPEAVLGGENPIIRINFEEELLDLHTKTEDTYGFHFWVLNHFNWDKGTNKNNQENTVEEKTSDEKKPSEEKTKQSKSDAALDELRESINVDYIEMPWSNSRKNVEDAILKIQDKMATILQPILDEVNGEEKFLSTLKSKVDDFESKDPKEIYECYIQQICTIINFDDAKLSCLAERNAKLLEEKLDVKKDADILDVNKLKNALIDKEAQKNLITSLAKITAYPNRMYDILVEIQKELSENSTEKELEGTIKGKQIIEYVKKYNSAVDDYYDRLVTAYILESKITANGSVDKVIKEWPINGKAWVNRKKYIQFSQIKNKTIGNIFMPSTYERKVLFPYKLSHLDENTLIKSLYSYLCAKKVELNSEKWLQKDKEIFSEIKSILMKDVPGIEQDANWKTLSPKSLNGDLEEKDQNGVSYLDLLILRSIFVPYRFFKQVRNDSVHARIERNEMINKDKLIELLEKSVKWIKTLQNSLK